MHLNPYTAAEQIVLILNRVYARSMTTTSGGNLSIRDDQGIIWITPSGIDKGNLTPADIGRVLPNGHWEGRHKPSLELPFHLSIYRTRPDIRAILHAHPPNLAAFAAARILPECRNFPEARQICGKVVMARYALAGSEALSEHMAEAFRDTAVHMVLMENHGVCVGALDMLQAFQQFETLESLAGMALRMKRLAWPEIDPACSGFLASEYTAADNKTVGLDGASAELSLRRDLAAMVQRAYRQRLFGGVLGCCSVRLPDGAILITPEAADHAGMEADEAVRLTNGQSAPGQTPSRWAALHQAIYAQNPSFNAIMGGCPANAMLYALCDVPFNTRVMMESYFMLRDVPKIPFSTLCQAPAQAAAVLSPHTPTVICANSQVLAAGQTLLNAFDRLEVTELTARALLDSRDIAETVILTDAQIKAIEATFLR